MDILSANNILFFIICFMPGFISIKVYDLLVPNERRDFSKSLFDVVAYSVIILVLWVFPLKWSFGTGYFWLINYFLVIPSSVALPIIYIKLLSTNFLSKYVVGPIKRPWDWVFLKKEPLFVIVRLSDNTKIGGVFFNQSYASSYPLPEQIYIEQVWSLDEEGRFDKPLSGSKGVIILGKDISSIEFFDK